MNRPAGALALCFLFLVASLSGPRVGGPVPVYGYEVVARYPHDREAFTQGLLVRDGKLYESTGLRGRSSVREVDLRTGTVLRRHDLPGAVFGEGLAEWGGRLIVLTWKSGIGFELDRGSFRLQREFRYDGQGWGLAGSPGALLRSDGTSWIRRLDPVSLRETGRFQVTHRGLPLDGLNELEWVRGEVFANVWPTALVARIDPGTGAVTGWVDLTGLVDRQGSGLTREDVANGIAHDEAGDRLFVTGKRWPWLFEIRLVPPG